MNTIFSNHPQSDDADVRTALHELGAGVPSTPIRDLDEVRVRGQRRIVRDRVLTGAGAAAAVLAVVMFAGAVRPGTGPTPEVASGGTVGAQQPDGQPDGAHTEEPAGFPGPSSRDRVTVEEIQAWLFLYEDFDGGHLIGDGAGQLMYEAMRTLTGSFAPGAEAPRDAAELAEDVAAYVAEGTTPTSGFPVPFLAESPELEGFLRRLELTLRAEAGLEASSGRPAISYLDTVALRELRDWFTIYRQADPVIRISEAEGRLIALAIESIDGDRDPRASWTLASEGITVDELAAQTRAATAGSELAGLLGRTAATLDFVATAPPVPFGAPETSSDTTMSLEELRQWSEAYWTLDSSYRMGDGAGLAFSLAIEVVTGVPEPREETMTLAFTRNDVASTVTFIGDYRRDGDGTYLSDNPELSDALRRLETMLSDLAG